MRTRSHAFRVRDCIALQVSSNTSIFDVDHAHHSVQHHAHDDRCRKPIINARIASYVIDEFQNFFCVRGKFVTFVCKKCRKDVALCTVFRTNTSQWTFGTGVTHRERLATDFCHSCDRSDERRRILFSRLLPPPSCFGWKRQQPSFRLSEDSTWPRRKLQRVRLLRRLPRKLPRRR